MTDLVLLKTYHTRLEAEIAQQRLKDLGIITIIKADDAGGMYPNLQHSLGVQLLTSLANANRARAILDSENTFIGNNPSSDPPSGA